MLARRAHVYAGLRVETRGVARDDANRLTTVRNPAENLTADPGGGGGDDDHGTPKGDQAQTDSPRSWAIRNRIKTLQSRPKYF